MNGITDLPTPETPRETAIYLGMLQGTVGQISAQMQQMLATLPEMATKTDIRELETRIDARVASFVTRTEAERMIADATRSAVPAFLRKALSWVAIIGGACGFVAAGWVFLNNVVHFVDKVPK